MNITDSILLLHTAILDNVLYPIASTSNLNHKPASFLLLLHNIMIALPFFTILLEPGNYLQNDPWNKKKGLSEVTICHSMSENSKNESMASSPLRT